MSEPRVTCVVPAYDYGRYLAAAIDSALAQDYPADRLEVLVVDDGSTDETPQVIAGYGDRIRSIRRPNGGLNAATQTGIDAATGELLTFLDADDTWPAGRVRALVDALGWNPRAALAYGDMAIVDDEGRVLEPTLRVPGGLQAHEGAVFGKLLGGNFISAGALMVRASLRGLYSPIPEQVPYQDWWIATQVARVADVVAVGAVVNRYRHHGANMNLGLSAHSRAGLFATEIPFRRWLLQTAEGLASPTELLHAVRELDARVQAVADARGEGPRAVLGDDTLDRAAAIEAMATASDALDAGAPERALEALAAAVAHDPLYPDPRELLAHLAPHVLAGRRAVAA